MLPWQPSFDSHVFQNLNCPIWIRLKRKKKQYYRTSKNGMEIKIPSKITPQLWRPQEVDRCCLILANPWVSFDKDHVSQFVGKPQVLTCYSTGSPLPEIKWLRNGKELHSGDLNETVTLRYDGINVELGKQAHQLVISNVQPDHVGNYTCEGRNKYFTRRQDILLTSSCKSLYLWFAQFYERKM